jgi:hypothetical protein
MPTRNSAPIASTIWRVADALVALCPFVGVLVALAFQSSDNHGLALQHNLLQDALVAGLGTIVSGVSGMVIHVVAALLDNWKDRRIAVSQATTTMDIEQMEARTAVYLAQKIEALERADRALKRIRRRQ